MEEKFNSLDKSVDVFSKEKEKLDIALYYTHHDSEKAKNMVSGAYKDMYVIKAKFNASTIYGAFLLFFNIPYCSFVHSFPVMSTSYEVDELKTKIEWRIFEEQMDKIVKKTGQNADMTIKLKNQLADAFTLKLGKDQRAGDLQRYMQMNDEISANRLFQKFLHDIFGFININLSVDYEQISSLDMELFSLSSKKIEKEVLAGIEQEKEEPKKEEKEEEDEDIDKEDIQLILRGALILSPIIGKPLSSVEVGDRIRINLDDSNLKAITVAKAFDAFHDGKIKPITGRVVSIRRLLDGGYKIYCIITNGIYVKIEEEEEDIKVAVEMPDEIEEEDGSRTPIIIALAFVFFIIMFVVLVLVLL